MDKQYKRKFKARESLYPILERVLKQNKVDFDTTLDGEQRYVHTNISGMQFRRYVEDALCVEQRGSRNIPVLPYRIVKNDKLRSKALNKANCGCYTVLHKDLHRVKRDVWQTVN